jgi:hypothetical protein
VKDILTLLKLDKLFVMDDRKPEEIIKDLWNGEYDKHRII